MAESLLIPLGFAIIAVGMLVVLGGVILAAFSQGGRTEAKAGCVIMLGPIPIIFGTDRNAALTAAALALMLMAAYYLISRKW